MKRTVVALVCLAAGKQVALAADPTPEELARVLSGDAAGAPGANPQCQLFTPDEIAAYLGEPVEAGANAGMGMACQWLASKSDGDAMITVVPAQYSERPSLAPGFEEVPALGADGFVVPEMGGWAAGVTSGDSFVRVAVVGPAASAAKAVELLRETLRRRGA